MQFQFLKGRYCLSFAVLLHLFDPQQAKTLTFSSFSANIPLPGTDCSYILEENAAYKQAVSETDSHVQPLSYWFALQTKNVSRISLTPLYVTCLFLLIPSMLSTV